LEKWRLIDLDYCEPLIAQTFYEAVAEAIHRNKSPNTLILLQPNNPYTCIGYHQELEKELDVEYIKKAGLPIIRRSQGGGATYLDKDQVFYQIVFKNTSVLPKDVKSVFEKLLRVTVETYNRLGVPARFKPINDVVVDGRKISGNGAGNHESASILVGNIILDLDYGLMSRVLKVPDEKFRDKMAKSMREWVTTLKRELGDAPSVEMIKETYASAFQDILGVQLISDEPSELEWRIYREETEPRHVSSEWLNLESFQAWRKDARAVKIAHDVKFVEVDHKAGKLIRVRAEILGSKINNIQIMGDMFVIPKEAVNTLEEMFEGIELDTTALTNTLEAFYTNTCAQTPGIGIDDFVETLMKLSEHI
jgi:lipoate-protein ligase A